MFFSSKANTDQSVEDHIKIYGFDHIDNIHMCYVSNQIWNFQISK